MSFFSKVGDCITMPFRHSDGGGLSPFEKGGCAAGTAVCGYAAWHLLNATAIVGARAGIGCFGSGYTSYLVPISKASIWFLKDAGAAATCSSELKTFVIAATALVTTGVVGYKLLTTWPNPSVSFGHQPKPPSSPSSHAH